MWKMYFHLKNLNKLDVSLHLYVHMPSHMYSAPWVMCIIKILLQKQIETGNGVGENIYTVNGPARQKSNRGPAAQGVSAHVLCVL